MTFSVKNYRVEGHARYTTMTLDAAEFIRRFLMHVLPKGFHRIRHYGLLATGARAENVERARACSMPRREGDAERPRIQATQSQSTTRGQRLPPCPCCGSRLRIIERFLRGETPTHQPSPPQLVFRFDTS